MQQQDTNHRREPVVACARRQRGNRDPGAMGKAGGMYLAASLAFFGVAFVGHHPPFIGVGFAFLGLALGFLANARRR